MAIEYLGHNGEDGMCIGNATTQKVGFYAKTPVAQQATAAVATDLATVIVLTTALRLALNNLGLTA
jgi:hypothetical protein